MEEKEYETAWQLLSSIDFTKLSSQELQKLFNALEELEKRAKEERAQILRSMQDLQNLKKYQG